MMSRPSMQMGQAWDWIGVGISILCRALKALGVRDGVAVAVFVSAIFVNVSLYCKQHAVCK